MLVTTLRDSSPASEPAERTMIGCEALYYAPSLRRRRAFQEELVPDVSRLHPVTAARVLEGSIDHLLAPLPDIFLAYCAAILLLWIKDRGPKLELDMTVNPSLRPKVAQFLERAEPSFRSRLFQDVWKATKAVVAALQRESPSGQN